MPVSHRERQQGVHNNAAWTVSCGHAVCVISYCTWSGEPVLPGRLVVVQGLQHDIHGECKQAGQEDVENYIEENNKTCSQEKKRVGSTVCNINAQKESIRLFSLIEF